jgi:hypothetical protein
MLAMAMQMPSSTKLSGFVIMKIRKQKKSRELRWFSAALRYPWSNRSRRLQIAGESFRTFSTLLPRSIPVMLMMNLFFLVQVNSRSGFR